MSKKPRKGSLFFDDPGDSDSNIVDDVFSITSSTHDMSHAISNEELLSMLQDSDFEENYNDSDYEFEDEEDNEDVSGVCIPKVIRHSKNSSQHLLPNKLK